MRLDEWHRFIESQFLEDRPDSTVHKSLTEEVPSLPPVAHDVLPAADQATLPVDSHMARDMPSGPGEVAAAPQVHAPLPFEYPDFLDADLPEFVRHIDTQPQEAQAANSTPDPAAAPPSHRRPRRVRSTTARHARNVAPAQVDHGISAADLLADVPRHIHTLLALEREAEEVAQASYKRSFTESRKELIERLIDPVLSLEETARLLNVCPTTVRRYTNRGILSYYRKEPDRGSSHPQEKETRQRRFRLSDILAFLEAQHGDPNTSKSRLKANSATEGPH